MKSFVCFLWISSVLATYGKQSTHNHRAQYWQEHSPSFEIITRDVAIIGAGSTGTYAAIKLRDLNRTVVVIERKGRMGGHTETYTDAETGTPINYGVEVWHDLDIVKNYFKRFNVSLTKLNTASRPMIQYFDFSTGRVNTNYTPVDPTAATLAYLNHLMKYPYLEKGFDLPDEVPPDLLLPFGEFVTKYQLDPIVNIVFTYGQGSGDIVSIPTLYVMKVIGPTVLTSIQKGFLTATSGNNSEIYGKAEAELGADVLLNSNVIFTQRDKPDSEGYVQVFVQTPSGVKFIRAKQILSTIPPDLDNIGPLAPDERETSVFDQFTNAYYFTAILRDAGLPPNLNIANTAPDTPFNLPRLPALYGLSPTAARALTNVKIGAPVGAAALATTDDAVKEAVIAAVRRLRSAGQLNFTTAVDQDPTFAAFSAHVPFECQVSREAIEDGFYRRLYALQGYRRLWWTGAAWHVHDSSMLWQFTERVVARIAACL